VRTVGKNQTGDVVCSFDRTILVQRRGHALEDKANY
jgi:itaconyl-CoA hydratase